MSKHEKEPKAFYSSWLERAVYIYIYIYIQVLIIWIYLIGYSCVDKKVAIII